LPILNFFKLPILQSVIVSKPGQSFR